MLPLGEPRHPFNLFVQIIKDQLIPGLDALFAAGYHFLLHPLSYLMVGLEYCLGKPLSKGTPSHSTIAAPISHLSISSYLSSCDYYSGYHPLPSINVAIVRFNRIITFSYFADDCCFICSEERLLRIVIGNIGLQSE